MKCSCSKRRINCDSECPLQQEEDYYTRKNIIVLLIIAFIVMILVGYCPKLQGQVPAMYSGGSLMQKMDRIQPTLWKYADGMDTSDSYCIHRSFDSTKTSVIYLIGFNEEGDENMRLVIEEAYYVPTLNICILYQNGMEIRLREKLF